VSIELQGFATQQQSVEIARGQISEVQTKLLRTTSEVEATSRGAPSAKASSLNWWLGGALALGAIPLVALPLHALARDGKCAEHAGWQCTERVEFGARSAVMLGAEAAALIAGTTLMIARPFAVGVDVSAERAVIRLRGAL
jgi:hypothetical protein